MLQGGHMLQIVEHDKFHDGYPCVVLNYSGFEIPTLTEYPALGEFNIKTFQTFLKNRNSPVAYDIVNMFLKTLSIEEQKQIVSTMAIVNGLLKQKIDSSKEVYELLDAIEQQLEHLDSTIQLCEKIHLFTEDAFNNNILPMADMSNAGQRPQDREDMTFYQNDARELTEIAIISKLVSPITGEFIYRHTAMVNSKLKETFATQIITRILANHYYKIVNKLTYYTQKLVMPKAKNDAAAHYRGYTPEMITRIIIDMCIIKKYATVDLFKAGGNIVTFTATYIKSFVDSLGKNCAMSFNIKTFIDPKDEDTITSLEETNSSRIETESNSSRKAAIVGPFVCAAADWFINEHLKDEKIAELYHPTYEWYLEHPAIMSPIGEIILANYFGPYLCGGKSIYLIDAIHTVQLAALLQTLLVQSGNNVLPHAVTMTVSAEDKFDVSDFSFTNSWRSSAEYIACKKVVVPGFGDIAWDNCLKKIVKFLVAKQCMYHTAESIWDMIGEQSKNKSAFDRPSELMAELLTGMRQLWVQRKVVEQQ